MALAAETAPEPLWDGPFRQLGNSQVESGFADHRTYLHEGQEVDQQIHLGFDLASTANAPILASNTGRVVFADYLGIYGNCVIVDHGMGLQSLYAHLSSISVSAGDSVTSDDQLGLSGRTGLAGGDHLHFAILLQGWPITPMEWWDSHWIDDRIMRKLQLTP
jgi:murein DD-endopeptidase MepM/ murein hydrolase activator NlpD